MKITCSEKILKLKINHKINRPSIITIHIDKNNYGIFPEKIVCDEIIFFCYKKKRGKINDVYYFSNNLNYKSLLKNKRKFFTDLNFNFMPECIITNNEINLIEKINKEYIFNNNTMQSFSFKQNEFDSIEISFQALWNYLRSEYHQIKDSIITKAYTKLKQSMPLVGDHKNIRIFDVKLEPKEYQWHRLNASSFFCLTKCLLQIDFAFFHEIFRSENLVFLYKKNEYAICKKTLEYKLQLPNNAIFQNWMPQIFYLKGDNVFFEDIAYKALIKHVSSDAFEQEKWEKINTTKQMSFYHCYSFFDSKFGKDCEQVLKKNLQFLIEKNIGNEIRITIIEDKLPKLNDYFIYHGGKYRIVEFNFKNISASYNSKFLIEIVGIEIINAIQFEPSDEWNHNGVLSNYTHTIHQANYNVHSPSFEGLTITSPDNGVILSEKKIIIKSDRSEH